MSNCQERDQVERLSKESGTDFDGEFTISMLMVRVLNHLLFRCRSRIDLRNRKPEFYHYLLNTCWGNLELLW